MSEVKQSVEGTPKAKELTPLELQQLKHEAELQRLELEAKELEIKFKKLQYSDLQDQVHDREQKRHDKTERSRINGVTINALARNDKAVQGRCNHRKGGNGANGVVAGQGDDSQYCVRKHIFANGDMWIDCLRCHKTWKPVMPHWFETQEGYLGAVAEYEAAKNFPTRNQTSSSVAFKWGDGGVFYRESMRNTNLR